MDTLFDKISEIIPWSELATLLIGIGFLYLKKVHGSLRKVVDQVTHNGGSSMLDSIARIELKITELAATNDVLQQISNKPLFRTDENGECAWVNSAYSEIVGKPLEDLLGHGWASIVDPSHRIALKNEWNSAISDGRRFDSTFHIVNNLKELRYKVRCRAYPVKVKGKVVGYIGGWLILEKQSLSEATNEDEP